jgi:hypothetical protein
MSRLLGCCVCEKSIEIWGWDGQNEFHREADGTGPYCDICWTFVERIEALELKLAEVVKPVCPKRQSPYDASRRRT